MGAGVDTDAIIDSVMSSLNLDQVIARAMRGLSGSGSTFTGTLTTRPQVTVRTSGSHVGDNSMSRFSGVSRQGGSSFTLQSGGSSSVPRSGSGVDKSALVGQVFTVLNPQIEKAVADALRALSSSRPASFGTTKQQNKFSSGSNLIRASSPQDESTLVSQIISMLTPSITQSVKSALSGKSTSVGQQPLIGSSSGLSSDFSSGVQQTVSTQQVDKNYLVQQVLTALGPTISAQVQAAIASMRSVSSSSSVQTNNQKFPQVQSVQVSKQEIRRLVRQIITTLTPSIRSSVQAALRAKGQTVTTVYVQPGTKVTFGSSRSTQASSAIEPATLVTRIQSVLQPRVMTLVSDAISSQETAAGKEQSRQAVLLEQQRIEQQKQAARFEQQRKAILLEHQRQHALLAAVEQRNQATLFIQQQQNIPVLSNIGSGLLLRL